MDTRKIIITVTNEEGEVLDKEIMFIPSEHSMIGVCSFKKNDAGQTFYEETLNIGEITI